MNKRLKSIIGDDLHLNACNPTSCVFCLIDAAIFQRINGIKRVVTPQNITKDEAAIEIMRSGS